MASTTPFATSTGLQCPHMTSPETQNLKKRLKTHKKMGFVLIQVSHWFPPHTTRLLERLLDQSLTLTLEARACLQGAHRCQPSAELLLPPGRKGLLQEQGRRGGRAQDVGCQCPACRPSSTARGGSQSSRMSHGPASSPRPVSLVQGTTGSPQH